MTDNIIHQPMQIKSSAPRNACIEYFKEQNMTGVELAQGHLSQHDHFLMWMWERGFKVAVIEDPEEVPALLQELEEKEAQVAALTKRLGEMRATLKLVQMYAEDGLQRDMREEIADLARAELEKEIEG